MFKSKFLKKCELIHILFKYALFISASAKDIFRSIATFITLKWALIYISNSAIKVKWFIALYINKYNRKSLEKEFISTSCYGLVAIVTQGKGTSTLDINSIFI